jgi:hypothetical protein
MRLSPTSIQVPIRKLTERLAHELGSHPAN